MEKISSVELHKNQSHKMARPTNKTDLLEQAEDNYHKLQDLIKSIDPKLQLKPGACEKWSVKDILAHLHAWHQLVFGWYETGQKGEQPAMPSEKYTWKQTPELNHDIYEKYKDDSLESVKRKFKSSHNKALKIIKSHTDKELFTRSHYDWTGNNALGAYFVSCTSSHYEWSIKLIRKFIKSNS